MRSLTPITGSTGERVSFSMCPRLGFQRQQTRENIIRKEKKKKERKRSCHCSPQWTRKLYASLSSTPTPPLGVVAPGCAALLRGTARDALGSTVQCHVLLSSLSHVQRTISIL